MCFCSSHQICLYSDLEAIIQISLLSALKEIIIIQWYLSKDLENHHGGSDSKDSIKTWWVWLSSEKDRFCHFQNWKDLDVIREEMAEINEGRHKDNAEMIEINNINWNQKW